MSTELVLKTIRLFVSALLFLAVVNIIGVDLREVHQFVLLLGTMVIFALLLRNIWLTLFIWWTVFLYSYFKFQIGNIYVFNIFLGTMLYFLTKVAFKKEHIDFLLKMVLWFVGANVVYMIFQVLGFDFIYKLRHVSNDGLIGLLENREPVGFMGYKACTAIVMVIGMPILMTRQWKHAIWYGLGLFIPIYVSRSSGALAAGILVTLLVLWYKVSRKVFYGAVISLLVLGSLYVWKVDAPMGTLPTRIYQWRETLKDCIIHPVTGWGLDSFRSVTAQKEHLYAMNPQPTTDGKGMHYDVWDNPHNLLVSIFFEWGIVGLFIFFGLLRQYWIWWKNSVKSPNAIALAGVIIGVLAVSMTQFPMFLARTAVLVIPLAALYEIEVR